MDFGFFQSAGERGEGAGGGGAGEPAALPGDNGDIRRRFCEEQKNRGCFAFLDGLFKR